MSGQAQLFETTGPARLSARWSFNGSGVRWAESTVSETNFLLASHHYLGPMRGFGIAYGGFTGDGHCVAAQIWKHPTARRLPQDGTWLELSRWCLTPEAGPNAGSRMHAFVTRALRTRLPNATTLVSYSDPSQGHTGALYRACNWFWAPTWLRLRPPPTGNGNWGTGAQSVKDRWVFPLRSDPQRAALLAVDDASALERFLLSGEWTEIRTRWRSTLSPNWEETA